MSALQPVRGTRDLLPDAMRLHRHVGDQARLVAGRYGFDEVATPVLEFTDVFARTLGVSSDVVSKEMYSFEDKGGDSLTLRPENTAGIARAFISNGLAQAAPCRFFYHGPMFRRERPQKGRQRQFHQIGIELIGLQGPLADVEVIACARAVLTALNLSAPVVLELNSLGDTESRDAWREALRGYFGGHAAALSEDSRRRLESNPLRILDSKDAGDREIARRAPPFSAYLNPRSQDFFRQVRDGLDALGIAYVLNPHLVRGLDYYSHTTFEFTTSALGAQGTVLAGGRYDGLIGQMGGPETPGVGWAAGVERLAMLAAAPAPATPPVVLLPIGEGVIPPALRLAEDLRAAGIAALLLADGAVGKRLKQAARSGARHAVLLGEEELRQGHVTLRDLAAGTQSTIALAAVAGMLAA